MQDTQRFQLPEERDPDEEGCNCSMLENGLTARKYLKEGIKLIIETEGNPVTLVIRLSKKQLISLLDKIIPD